MNEEQIRQLWQAGNKSGQSLDQAERLFSDRADQRAEGIAAVAADARAAVLARMVLSLREDAEGLERAVAAQRRPKLMQGARLRWAMAASLAAVALLLGALQLNPNAQAPEGAADITRADRILTGSFESTAGDTPATAGAAPSTSVFSAGFDS